MKVLLAERISTESLSKGMAISYASIPEKSLSKMNILLLLVPNVIAVMGA